MRIHYLQHVPFEPLGSIAPWADARGHRVVGTHVYEGEAFPEQDSFDVLVVMGGPMSVNDEDKHPWLRDEKSFIEETLQDDKAILGFCLGGQLIANAAGAAVAPNEHREIGWFPVKRSAGAPANLFPDEVLVFHWHSERFELPSGAVHLASSEGCDNQAFLFDDRVLAMQFHMEFTPEIVAGLAERLQGEMAEGGPYVQDTEAMLADSQRFEELRRVCETSLDAFFGNRNG